MKKLLGMFFASSLVLVGLAATSASAQTNVRRHPLPFTRKPWHNINQRQQNQDKRIYQGIRSGELTPREAQRLENRDDRIDHQEAGYRKSGGKLSYRERYRLERSLNRQSRDIYKQKHDNQTYPKP